MVISDTNEARRLVEIYLAEVPRKSPNELSVMDEHTIETDFGWVFFWNSKKYLQTGDLAHALAGNAPLIVDRRDGSLHETSTAKPVEDCIDEYRKYHWLAERSQ